jgi:hypothetical protein
LREVRLNATQRPKMKTGSFFRAARLAPGQYDVAARIIQLQIAKENPHEGKCKPCDRQNGENVFLPAEDEIIDASDHLALVDGAHMAGACNLPGRRVSYRVWRGRPARRTRDPTAATVHPTVSELKPTTPGELTAA